MYSLAGNYCSTTNPCGADNMDYIEGQGTGIVAPVINSIYPPQVTIGTAPVQVTISGSGVGGSPTVNVPTGVTATVQASTNSSIIVKMTIGLSARVGSNTISVTTNGQTSNSATLVIDGPYHLVVQSDVTGKCSGCNNTVARFVTYQVRNFSGVNAGTTGICEIATNSGWSCKQPDPGTETSACSINPTSTLPNGTFTDEWSLNSDAYTPVGCGMSTTDSWKWSAHLPVQDLGTLTGYIHTNAIRINGVTSPAGMTPGTVVPF